jgi:CRP-like cAMP-binding protein
MRRTETLRQIRLFQSLDAAAIAALDTQCSWKRCAAGQWLVDYQDESNDVFFMLTGAAHVMIQSAGRAVLLRELRAGEFFGELAAIDGRARSAGILAVTDVITARMPNSVFQAALQAHADVSGQLIALLVGQIRMLANRVYEFSTLDIRYRVYAELLRLSRPSDQHIGWAIISPPPLHAEMAARVSTRREAITRELMALERAKLIERRRGAIVLTDPERLRQMLAEAENA